MPTLADQDNIPLYTSEGGRTAVALDIDFVHAADHVLIGVTMYSTRIRPMAIVRDVRESMMLWN